MASASSSSSSAAAEPPNIQSVALADDVIARQKIFAATDAAHDHGPGWATAGGGILTQALDAAAMVEDAFIAQYSTTSTDGTRYKNAEARKSAKYDVPFYPRTDSWKPGFVFAPFGPRVPWLTAHDAGSSHPGQRPCLHFNLADTASRLRSRASKPVFCKLPNLFLSANDIGIKPEYVEVVVFYGFSLYTSADTGNAAGVKPFNDQKDGGKVKCKILVKMSPAGNGNFAWYDLTDVETASRPKSFSAAVASAKWKVLNTNAGYFMGNENSASLFTPDEDPTKVLLATIAKLIGDMTTALASSDWMAQFHPGGAKAISNDWIDAWTGEVAFSEPIPILGESGDRLQVWQGADRNGATLYTGSRQDENKMQTATFMPGQVDPEQQLLFMKGKLRFLHDTLDNQYSTLLAQVTTYMQDVTSRGHEGLFKDTAYVDVKDGNYRYVKDNLLKYLGDVSSQILAVYNEVKAEGGILDRTDLDTYTSLTYEQIKGLHDVLSMQIVDLMPQKTSFFIKEPTKLHKAFQIMKGRAVLPSPSDAITKINTTARYRKQSGGARSDDALDAFAIALRIPMPLDPADPMFRQFANMIPSAAAPAAPAAAPQEPPQAIEFPALIVIPNDETIARAAGILNAIREPIHLHEKWDVMKSKWGGVDEAFDNKDTQIWDEIENSRQIAEDAADNIISDENNALSIKNSPRSITPPSETNDTPDAENFIRSHFVPYGARVNTTLPDWFSSDIVASDVPALAPEVISVKRSATSRFLTGPRSKDPLELFRGIPGPGSAHPPGSPPPVSTFWGLSPPPVSASASSSSSSSSPGAPPPIGRSKSSGKPYVVVMAPRASPAQVAALTPLSGVKRPRGLVTGAPKYTPDHPVTPRARGGHRKTFRRRRLPKLL